MFTFFKNKDTLLKEKIKFLQSRASNRKQFSNKFISKVAILTTETISNQFDLRELVEKKLNVRNAKVYSYREFDKENEPSTKYFSERDITKRCKILDVSFNDFLTQEFSLLITILDASNLYVDFVTAISKANYKVGFANEKPNFFDLEIKGNIDNLDEFLSELKKYLIILKKLPSK